MTALTFAVVDARPADNTAAPAIAFRLRVNNCRSGRIHAIALRCHTRIEPRKRSHRAEEQERLYELFGEPAQWSRTLQPVTWAHSSAVVPSFERQIEIDLAIPCTYDLEVASAKYLYAVRDGHIPLVFLFNGTVFSVDEGFSVEPLPWDLEASFRMPAAVWHEAMNRFFPGEGWLRLQRDTLDRLQQFRGRQALVTWDQAIELLLQYASSQPSV